MSNMIRVGMADYRLCRPPQKISTLGLGSCLGVILYDAEQSVDPKKCQSNEVCGYLFKGHVRRTVKTGKPKGKYDCKDGGRCADVCKSERA